MECYFTRCFIDAHVLIFQLANKLEQLDPQQLDFVQNLYNRSV